MSAREDFAMWTDEADDPQLTIVSREALLRLFAEVDWLRAVSTEFQEEVWTMQARLDVMKDDVL